MKYNVRFKQEQYYDCRVEAETREEAIRKATEESIDCGYENCFMHEGEIEFDGCWED